MIDKTVFIRDLNQIPEEVWVKILKKAYALFHAFPDPVGIDTFLRGECAEIIAINLLQKNNQAFNQNPDKTKYSGAPDGMYLVPPVMFFYDMKLKFGGMEPATNKKHGVVPLFLKKMWDFKKTQSGSNEFKTDNDFYILLDPLYIRVAVCESTVLYNKKYPKNGSRICFGIAPEDVTVIFDGYGRYDFSGIKSYRMINKVFEFIDQQIEALI